MAMKFKITARVISQLGTELISSDEISIYELVKNGFDAGSQIVEVSINYSLAPGGDSQRRLLVTSDDPDESPFPGGVFINVSATPIGDDEVFKDSFE